MTWEEVHAEEGVMVWRDTHVARTEESTSRDANTKIVVISDANLAGGRGRSFTGATFSEARKRWFAAKGN